MTIPTITYKEEGARPPETDFLKFDGNVMNWRTFWEQYHVCIDSKPELSNTKKLAYLQWALKDDQSMNVIEGLSRMGGDYLEAVKYLCKQYEPHLIHHEHVCALIEMSLLKDGSRKELHVPCLHNVLSQHFPCITNNEA